MSTQSNTPTLTSGQANMYGLYSLCQNLAIMTPYMYVQMFMTDILLIDVKWVTTALLFGRVVDFILSVIAGGIIEKAHLKWGKYRSFIVIGRFTLFFGIILQLTNTSALPVVMRLVIATLGYTMMHGTMDFVATSTYGLLALISGPSMENRRRLSVASSRFAAASSIITSAAILPTIDFMVKHGVDRANAYMFTAAFFACFILIGSFALLSLSKPYDTAEMWSKVEGKAGVSFKDMIEAVVSNRQLLVYMLGTTFTNIGAAVFSAFQMYYFRLILGNINYYTIAATATTVFGLVAAMFVPPLGKKLGKRMSLITSYLWIGACYVLTSVILMFLGKDMTALVIYIFLRCLLMVGTYLATGYGANFIIDIAEYGFWKTKKDNRAVVMSMMNVPMKIGIVIGGSLGGYLLSMIGYSGALTPDTITATFERSFLLSWMGVCAAFYVAAGLLFAFAYKLSDEEAAKYAAENAARLAAGN